MQDAAIEVESLRKTYRDGLFGSRHVKALQDVSFDVPSGIIFGLLGPNGAGKTTLIKILLGLVYKSGGRASLLGREAGNRIGRRDVGYLPEHHRVPRHLTGNAALNYYGGLSGMSPGEVKRRRPDLLAKVGLEQWGAMPVRKYSKGMQQRLGLAQAMLHDPQMLILDEPTDGVDPVGRSEMRQLLQQLRDEGKTIFINSHLLQEVELVCDCVAILVEGSLRRVGTVAEITNRRHTDVVVTVRSTEAIVREALKSKTISACTERGDELQIVIKAPEQADLNDCIDRLRSHAVDILAIARSRDSLEDAFLNIVTGGTP